MHSCMAPRAGQAALVSRGCTACGSHAGRRQQASARHAAALQHRRRPAPCRAEQQDAEQGEQQAEAPMSAPKFLFDEDPTPPGEGGDGPLEGNQQFASVFKAAMSRQPGAAEGAPPPPAPPPPMEEQPAEQPAQQTDDADEPFVDPGPKFLFDEDPTPPAADGSGDMLSANPAFASVFKASLERSRSARDGSGSEADAPAAGGKPAAAQQGSAPPAPPPPPQDDAAPPAMAAAPAAPPAPPQQLLDPQQGGRNLPNSQRQPSAAEEVLLAALRDSRRNILGLQRMYKDVEDALKREDQQFNRLHFALQKAQSDSARMGALQQMLDRRGPPQ